MELSQRLGGIGEYYFSRKNREIDSLRNLGREIINLGIGSPDMPPAPSVVARLATEAARSDTHAYQSYQGALVLRKAFADWYERMYGVVLDPKDEILPLIGSKEGIMHIVMTYINRGDRVLIPNPGYPTYRGAATIAGAELVEYKLTAENGWLPDFDSIDPTGVKIMMINYPNMPTGARPTRELFEQVVEFGRRNRILIVHDNPYSFIRNPHPMSMLSVDGAKEVVVELNSLSKSHSMAGWRIGMVGGSSEHIADILRFKSNMDSGMFYPMQAAAAEALSLGEEWYEELNETYRRREKLVLAMLDKMGCSYQKDQSGLFVWARLPEGAGDCYTYTDHILYDCGVFITPGGIFGSEGTNYIRVSLCAKEEVIERACQMITSTSRR